MPLNTHSEMYISCVTIRQPFMPISSPLSNLLGILSSIDIQCWIVYLHVWLPACHHSILGVSKVLPHFSLIDFAWELGRRIFGTLYNKYLKKVLYWNTSSVFPINPSLVSHTRDTFFALSFNDDWMDEWAQVYEKNTGWVKNNVPTVWLTFGLWGTVWTLFLDPPG